MRHASEHDVLVAGAGPAGAHLALRLAREGLVVGLLDRATFPRAKPCGEFLSPECLPLLDEVGLLDATLAAAPARVAGMRLAGFGSVACGRYRRLADGDGRPEHGLGLRREELDRIAVRRASEHPSIDVRLGWSVSGPVVGARGRVVGVDARDPDGRPVRLRAGFVVGADGAASRVARGLGWRAAQDQADERWAIVARFAGVQARELAEVHFTDGGYFAACSTDAGTFTANLVVGRDALRPGRDGPARVFAEGLARAPELAQRLAHARPLEPPRACGPLSVRARRRTGPGAALVGDASGFVDPLTGEGLFFAMRGAALLAEAIAAAHADRSREPAALRRYEQGQRLELGPRRAFARLLQRGLRHPALVRRALAALARHPGLADLVVTFTGDTLPPRGLLRPRTWRAALFAR